MAPERAWRNATSVRLCKSRLAPAVLVAVSESLFVRMQRVCSLHLCCVPAAEMSALYRLRGVCKWLVQHTSGRIRAGACDSGLEDNGAGVCAAPCQNGQVKNKDNDCVVCGGPGDPICGNGTPRFWYCVYCQGFNIARSTACLATLQARMATRSITRTFLQCCIGNTCQSLTILRLQTGYHKICSGLHAGRLRVDLSLH